MLWLEVEFYSIISYALSIAFGILPWMGVQDFAKNIFPILGKNYWFISSYILMYFLSPFLNHFIGSANYKMHLLSIAALLCCFSLPQFVPHVHWMSSEGYIEIFITLYMAGAFIRKYDLFHQNKRRLVAVTLLALFCLILSEIVLKLVMPERFSFFVWHMNKISVIGISVLIFGTLKGKAISLPPLMLRCAQSVFGVYLIHIGRMEKWFFERAFDISGVYRTPYFAIVLFCYAFIIFVFCILIDQLRILLFERPVKPAISKWANAFEKRFGKIIAIDKREQIPRDSNAGTL